MSYTPLNSLNAFVAVARRRSFAAAARERASPAQR
jgi:DNA-binding transcriptional LysR family regulator